MRDNKGNKIIKTLLGYVAGIMYNSEGSIGEWLYNKKGHLTGYEESARMYKTMEQAGKFLMKREHMGTPFVREYYLYTYKGRDQ